MSTSIDTVGQVGEDVRAALTFIVPQKSKPYFESSASTGGEPRVHFETQKCEVTLHDMRPHVHAFRLDGQGFTLRTAATRLDLEDDAAVASDYAAELECFLRAETGADHVAIFDYTRRSDAPEGAGNPDGARRPADRVHVDYTVDSGPKRARDALGAPTFDGAIARGARVVQVNVWRPIRGPVLRSPLALADATSITATARVATDQVFPDRIGEIYQIAHEPGQRWYWAPRMSRDEVLLIKGWDSCAEVPARFTPHGAFSLPDQDPYAPPRHSIEARTYLIFEP